MKSRWQLLLVALAFVPSILMTGCGSSSSTPAPTVVSVAVTPAASSVAPGDTQQLTVTATYSDATTGNVTSGCTFASSSNAVATVSAGGLVTAVAAGTATITATHTASAKTGTAAVQVVSVVFRGGYAPDVTFADFGGAANDVSVDATVLFEGRASLKFVVTGTGAYSGGALVTSSPQDLSGFNALTFWAKASTANDLNVAGIGNDATGSEGYSAEITAIPLTGTWTKFAIPVPNPAKLIDPAGLFHLADGPKGYTIWLNNIQYEKLPASLVGAPTAAAIAWTNPTIPVAGTFQMANATTTVTFPASSLVTRTQVSNVSFRYFDLVSATPAAATVSRDGLVTGVAIGTSDITAWLGTLAVPGLSTVNVTGGPTTPTTAAPTPTKAAADVIAMYNSSGTYTNAPNINWAAGWGDPATYTAFPIPGTASTVLEYDGMSYVGVEFYSPVIDASAMNYLHVDVWTPNGHQFGVKLVNDAGGPAAAEAEVHYNEATVPAITTGSWISLDIPLANFTGMPFNKLNQLLWLDNVGGPERATFFIDNVYFWRSSAPTVPTTAAPTPTKAAANVVSLYNSSATYTNASVTTWATAWGNPNTVTDYTIAGTGRIVKEYNRLAYAGVDFAGFDASTFTHMHIDVWTPDALYFGIKLVNNAGGSPATEAIVAFGPSTTPPLTRGGWVSLDIPLTSFAGMSFTNLNQLLWLDNRDAGAPGDELGTFFIDNVYFWK